MFKSKGHPTGPDTCQWDERTTLFVHALDIAHALYAAQQHSESGPHIVLECSSVHLLSSQMFGSCTILLKDIMQEALSTEGVERVFGLRDAKDQPVSGPSGETSTITLHLKANYIDSGEQWRKPSLADTLNSSEGKVWQLGIEN